MYKPIKYKLSFNGKNEKKKYFTWRQPSSQQLKYHQCVDLIRKRKDVDKNVRHRKFKVEKKNRKNSFWNFSFKGYKDGGNTNE